MAANTQSRGIASFGKRFANQIWSANSRNSSPVVASSPVSGRRSRGVHTSVYDKNVDDQLRPSVVPDDMIEPQSDKYWEPHPQTGVFGPATDLKSGPAGAEGGRHSSPAANGSADEAALEQKVWFRPLEDIEKQPY